MSEPASSPRSTGSDTADPFLKWSGGKRWLAPALSAIAFGASGTYFEPFLGSGASYFAMPTGPSVLADVNTDLVNAYITVRDHVEELIHELRRLAVSRETFTRVRDADPASDVQRAVRLLYLNRTAFNGIYRVNREGKFNVPYGCRPTTILCRPSQLRAASRALQGADLRVSDFRDTVASAKPGDVVYADPPYTVTHNRNDFPRFNSRIFSWRDQEQLARVASSLASIGVHVLVSNAGHPEVLRLYDSDAFHFCSAYRVTRVAPKNAHRRVCRESLMVSRSLAASPDQLRRAVRKVPRSRALLARFVVHTARPNFRGPA